MPSFRVSMPTLSLRCFDVVGQDNSVAGFIGHVGLAEFSGPQDSSSIPVVDMGPPLHGEGAKGRMIAAIVGSATLSDDEIQKIRTFVDRHANEHAMFSHLSGRELLTTAPKMYCVLPHACPFYEDNGRYTRTRFSCAGFALEAYKKARIELLHMTGLPAVEMAVIAAAYPDLSRFIERKIIRADDLGLSGNGPWPVLLCGYLFHSLSRDAGVIRQKPYTPNVSDCCFH